MCGLGFIRNSNGFSISFCIFAGFDFVYENQAALERAQKERLEICYKYDKVSIPLVSHRIKHWGGLSH